MGDAAIPAGAAEQRTSDGRYLVSETLRLFHDAEFQKRFAADPELNRLMNPRPEQADYDLDSMQALGMTRRIMGVEVPPVTIGMLRLLSATGNEFVASPQNWTRGFTYNLHQLCEALYVLTHGAHAVAQFGEFFRWRRVIATWEQAAKSDPAKMAVVLDAELKAAQGLKAWDAAVFAFSESQVRLEGDETVTGAIQSLDAWLGAGLAGFDLFPRLKQTEETQKKTAGGLMRSLRLLFARGLVDMAFALLRGRCGGK
jgi:hypothetical protein